MFFRRSLSLFLIGIGIGSPWLVRDWLGARSHERGSNLAEVAEPTWTDQLREKFRRFESAGGTGEASPVESAPAPESASTVAHREAYPLASTTKQIMEGFLGGRGGLGSGGLKEWFPSGTELPATERSRAIVEASLAHLAPELAPMGLKPGDPVFLRAFKEESELEIWMKPEQDPHYVLFKVHRLSVSAGQAGPKLREGDGQAPEGFYSATASSMRPETRHYLGIDLGYPNEYDRERGRTGSDLLIHAGGGAGVAYALSPETMNEVYALADAAFRGGQRELAIHLFPFRLTDARMDKVWAKPSRWAEEWVNLKEGYDFFENVRIPPRVEVEKERYGFRLASGENASGEN
jgi:murein L,D-transpeptidase YafK